MTVDSLQAGLSALGLDLDTEAQQRLTDYAALVEKWNRTFNLTAIRDPAKMRTHHLLDSLAVLRHLPSTEGASIADVGSGAGFPGIPLAIASPRQHFVLVDSNHKKGTFLRQAVIELGLANIDVVVNRVEDYRPVRLFDAVVSRAFAELATFVELAGHLVSETGSLLAMKARPDAGERSALPANARIDATHELDVPGLGAPRCLIVMSIARP